MSISWIGKQLLILSETAGSLLSLPQPTEATGNNSDASPQVETSRDVPRKKVIITPEEEILRMEKFALQSMAYQEKEDQRMGLPTSPKSQAMRTKRIAMFERDLADVKRFRDLEQESQRPPGKNLLGQRVLTEAFFINRLEEIRQFAGDTKLKDFTNGFERDIREEEISRIFRRFRRENGEGDPPYYCDSATMMGRLTHTFKEEYVAKDKVRRTACELDLHVDGIKDEAKRSMRQDAKAIRMQTQNLIDKRNKMLLDAHNQCEEALSAVHSRMKDASKAYGDAYEEALNQQLQIVKESTITEDTLKQEMLMVLALIWTAL